MMTRREVIRIYVAEKRHLERGGMPIVGPNWAAPVSHPAGGISYVPLHLVRRVKKRAGGTGIELKPGITWEYVDKFLEILDREYRKRRNLGFGQVITRSITDPEEIRKFQAEQAELERKKRNQAYLKAGAGAAMHIVSMFQKQPPVITGLTYGSVFGILEKTLEEVDKIAEIQAGKGYTGKPTDPLPKGISKSATRWIKDHPKEFQQKVATWIAEKKRRQALLKPRRVATVKRIPMAPERAKAFVEAKPYVPPKPEKKKKFPTKTVAIAGGIAAAALVAAIGIIIAAR